MKDRIAQIVRIEGLSLAEFTQRVGIAPATMSHILNGRNKPSLDVVTRIHEAFNDISLEWLLFGTGEMRTAQKTENNVASSSLLPFADEMPEIAQPVASAPSIPNYQGTSRVHNPIQEVRVVEKPERKITEIRIFFDNGTFEIFHPEK